ncbi:MAG: hypothetical protein N2Z81_00475 [Hydrogenothermaceae bacterium]|nr:hypothetical protein [Hydrogenothermaceae bacterium]
MEIKDRIIREIDKLTEESLQQILSFILLIENREKKMEISLLSEKALGKDWLKPEEDEAWKDL